MRQAAETAVRAAVENRKPVGAQVAWGGRKGVPQSVYLEYTLWMTRSKASQETLRPGWKRHDGRKYARLLLEAETGEGNCSAHSSFLGHHPLTFYPHRPKALSTRAKGRAAGQPLLDLPIPLDERGR